MSPKVSEEYKDTVRGDILRAAERVFAKSGYNAASMDDIVRESGLSKGAIYGYFDSKEGLFLALQALQGEVSLEEMAGGVPASASVVDKLTRVGELVFEHQAHMDRDALRVAYEFWTAAPRIKAVHRRNANNYRANHRFLSEMIREGMKRGEFREDVDPDALASILMAASDGLGLHWATIGVDLDWDAVRKTFLSVVREGILRRSRRSPR